MADESEWGPWIKHDGKGCQCVGQMVEAVVLVNRLGDLKNIGPFIAKGRESWTWKLHRLPVNEFARIIRYRIRKQRGMTILESLLENLPQEVDA